MYGITIAAIMSPVFYVWFIGQWLISMRCYISCECLCVESRFISVQWGYIWFWECKTCLLGCSTCFSWLSLCVRVRIISLLLIFYTDIMHISRKTIDTNTTIIYSINYLIHIHRTYYTYVAFFPLCSILIASNRTNTHTKTLPPIIIINRITIICWTISTYISKCLPNC
jgi:hypothetical protein